MSSKNNKKPPEPIKYERTFTYDDCIVVWRYDSSKTNSGPYEVEMKYPKKKGK
jgi:hypothetical protein